MTYRLFFLVILVASLLLGLQPSQAAGLKFSPELTGTYRAKLVLVTNGSTAIGSKLHAMLTVPTNGRELRLTIDGFSTTFQSGSTPVDTAMLGNLKFTSNRRVISDSALIAYYIKVPASGRVSGQKKLHFTLAFSDSFLGSVTMNYSCRIQGKRLFISGTGTIGSTPASVSFVAKRQGR